MSGVRLVSTSAGPNRLRSWCERTRDLGLPVTVQVYTRGDTGRPVLYTCTLCDLVKLSAGVMTCHVPCHAA